MLVSPSGFPRHRPAGLAILFALLLAGCADPSVPTAPPGRPGPPLPAGWLATAAGCRIWDPHPVPDESVVWSGACADGYGEGPGRILWNRPFRSRNPDGTFSVDPSLSVTTGTWEGTLRRGIEQGPAVVVDFGPNGGEPRATTQVGYAAGLAEGPGSTVFTSGARYDGGFHLGARSGIGRLSFGSGSHYEGGFEHGLPDGPGRLVILPADAGYHAPGRFDGTWHRGCLQRPGDRICVFPG